MLFTAYRRFQIGSEEAADIMTQGSQDRHYPMIPPSIHEALVAVMMPVKTGAPDCAGGGGGAPHGYRGSVMGTRSVQELQACLHYFTLIHHNIQQKACFTL